MTADRPTFNGGCLCSDCATLPPVVPEPHEPRLEVTDEWAGGAL